MRSIRLVAAVGGALLAGLLASTAALGQDVYASYDRDRDALYNDQTSRYRTTQAEAAEAWQANSQWQRYAEQVSGDRDAYVEALSNAEQWMTHHFALWRYYGEVNLARLEQLKQRYAAYPDLVSEIDGLIRQERRQLAALDEQERTRKEQIEKRRNRSEQEDGTPDAGDAFDCGIVLIGVQSCVGTGE